jgi:hypothetical protein
MTLFKLNLTIMKSNSVKAKSLITRLISNKMMRKSGTVARMIATSSVYNLIT